MFILHLPPPTHGSSLVGQYVKNSLLINEFFECSFINLTTSIKIDEIGAKSIKKIFRYLLILSQVFFKLLKFEPDLCYIALTAKGIAFYKDAFLAIIVKLFNVKLVYHFHNKGVSNYQNIFWYNLFYTLIFKKSNAILLSEYLYYDVQKYFPEARIYYCPNGIPDSYKSELKSRRENEPLNLLFLSNLIKTKGVYIILEVCRILKTRALDFTCSFVGSEGDISKIELEQGIENLGLKRNIVYKGPKYGSEKVNELIKSDILLFPTYYESFGLVILEAMQFSLPVLSTFEGAIPEIVIDGETGFLCKQQDAECISDKIETLIKNPSLRIKMGIAGRKRYEENFTLEHFEKKFAEILDNILNENK